jgi:hypothetical protein
MNFLIVLFCVCVCIKEVYQLYCPCGPASKLCPEVTSLVLKFNLYVSLTVRDLRTISLLQVYLWLFFLIL